VIPPRQESRSEPRASASGAPRSLTVAALVYFLAGVIHPCETVPKNRKILLAGSPGMFRTIATIG
jgi:hypothetical protein